MTEKANAKMQLIKAVMAVLIRVCAILLSVLLGDERDIFERKINFSNLMCGLCGLCGFV